MSPPCQAANFNSQTARKGCLSISNETIPLSRYQVLQGGILQMSPRRFLR
jgi:hypothetical protein